MAGAQELIMIFCCQDVFLALPVLMFTYKKLQLTASALTEREQARVGEIMSFPERKRGRKRARKRERKQNQALSTASLDVALSPWQMTSKVLVQAAPAPTQLEPPPSIGSVSQHGARGKAGKAPVRQIRRPGGTPTQGPQIYLPHPQLLWVRRTRRENHSVPSPHRSLQPWSCGASQSRRPSSSPDTQISFARCFLQSDMGR